MKTCLQRPGGCPYLYVKNDTITFEPDNNILHKSEFTENQGIDITDLYKLKIPPFINNNIIELALVENEQDHSYFNQVKLYAVDHEPNKKLGITEDNQLVLYDTTEIISPNYAALNGNDVTYNLQYNTVNTNPVKTTSGDSLHADYLSGQQPIKKNSNYEQTMLPIAKSDNNNEIKLKKESKQAREIRKLRVSTNDGESYGLLTDSYNWDTLNPIQSKSWAGKIVSSYTSSYRDTVKFAIREKSSTNVIPIFYNMIFPDTLNYIDVDMYRDMKSKYWCLMPLYFQGINSQEVRFVGATKLTRSNSVDVYSDLSDLDLLYAELDDTSLIKLQFDISNNPPQLGKTRDYVFEVNGRYIPGGSKDKIMSGIINQVLSKMYLYHNYPNPFNPSTTIKFDLNKDHNIKITVYNVLGQEVRVLLNEFRKAGTHNIIFDGTNLASGVYFYRMEAGNGSSTIDFTESKKMILVK